MLHCFHLAAAVWAKPPTIRRGILSRDAVQRRCRIGVYAYKAFFEISYVKNVLKVLKVSSGAAHSPADSPL